jgi:hypothetical protein
MGTSRIRPARTKSPATELLHFYPPRPALAEWGRRGRSTPGILRGHRDPRSRPAPPPELTDFRASALEVTVECNPESLDRDKAAALLDLGATRLSIGFQSLRDETLKLFGRVHDAAMSFRAFEAAREAGATELNVDLIFAAPGQGLEEWEQDLARVLALGPEHLSAYDLTFEEDTLFRRLLDQGRLKPRGDRGRPWVARACANAARSSRPPRSRSLCAGFLG